MYDELVKALHDGAEFLECSTPGIKNSFAKMCHNASDAIQELSKLVDESIPKDDAEIIIAEVAKPRWIPVTERLPEVDQPVMICAFGKSVGEGVYRGHDGFHHVWKMYTSSGTYWDDEVTHWMPLPEPPKEE